MTLMEVGELFYGFSLHFNRELNFDFLKLKYKIPKRMAAGLVRYNKRHIKSLERFLEFDRREVVVLAIVNQLKYRSDYMVSYDLGEEDNRWFIDLLINYKSDYQKDIEFLVDNLEEIRDVFTFHSLRKINWFTMLFVYAFIQFEGRNDFFDDEVIKEELWWSKKAVDIFNFDKVVLKELTEPLQKKIDLRR